MIIDDRNYLSDKQAIVASDFSDSSLDLGQEGVTYDLVQLRKRKGVGEMIPMYIGVNEDFDALTSLNIAIQTSNTVDGAGDLNGTISTILTVNVLLADLVAGYIYPLDKLPRTIRNRYLQFRYDVVGANPTVGKISAGFVAAVDGMNKSGF